MGNNTVSHKYIDLDKIITETDMLISDPDDEEFRLRRIRATLRSCGLDIGDDIESIKRTSHTLWPIKQPTN